MADNFATTIYFAVGYLTKAQKEQRDRHNLLGERSVSPDSPPSKIHIVSTHITVFQFNTGSQVLDIGIDNAPAQQGTGTFQIARMFPTFAKDGKAIQQAFDDFMQSDGRGIFGETAAVQLFSVDLSLAPPVPRPVASA